MTQTQEFTAIGQRVVWIEFTIAGEDVRRGAEGTVTDERFRRGQIVQLTVEFDNGEMLDVQPADVQIIG